MESLITKDAFLPKLSVISLFFVILENCVSAQEENGILICNICDFNFRPEFESEMKKNSISYESSVQCIQKEKMENCQDYDASKRKCLTCNPGFSLNVEIKETVIDTTPASPAPKMIDPKMVRILQSLDTTEQVVSTPEVIDDSNKEIKFEEIISCKADPDIPSCIEHSEDKQNCLLCEMGMIYNNKEKECQSVLLVEKGCLKYGPYNSCFRCVQDYYLDDLQNCKKVEKPVKGCHLYNVFQTCSLCKKGFALSKDKQR